MDVLQREGMSLNQYLIVSINVGKPSTLYTDGQEIQTGIVKRPVHAPVHLKTLNFEGDGQADLVHHGGADKAVCVYPHDHYVYWENDLKLTLSPGAFGENLTVKGLTEDKVHIGDIFQLGEAVVQVSQPRQPCFKLAKRYGIKELPLKFQTTGFTGYYFRVLQEGIVRERDALSLLEEHPMKRSVQYANTIMHHDKKNREGIEMLLNVDALSANWRATFEKRLQGIEPDASKRLEG